MRNIKRKGFTLLEVMVSMFIFTLMISASSGFFLRFMQAKENAQSIQRNLEDVQFVMNFMTKILRISTITGVSGTAGAYDGLIAYDYSQKKCVAFVYEDRSIEYGFISGENPSDCEALIFADFVYGSLISGSVNDFKMDVIPATGAPDPKVGIVTILIEVAKGKNEVGIQSSVSLRVKEGA